MCGINVYSCQDDDWWNKLYTDSKKLVGGINVLQLVRSWWVGLMCYSQQEDCFLQLEDGGMDCCFTVNKR